MPGILPMKVIKVGNSSQSRIAQACDRCRSKKIRCDGIRPCCSQCASVSFECRTSDKLSRRAFPRGYTESLEERVRQLECEVRELKDLLDEKDEKIDMLSKMHGNRRPSVGSAPSPKTAEVKADPATPPLKEDTFRVQASPLLLGVENSDSYFMGASSGRAFIETFKRKIQESGKSCSDFNPEAFLHIQGCYPLIAKPSPRSTRVPPRLFSDRCVNVYFQEWAPLFPVLHKPSFLRVYEEFVADPEKVKGNHKLTQLYLVFSIASLSGEHPDLEQITACEQLWRKSLDAILMDNTMVTLQCLVLALMYCTVRADYKRLQHYKGVAIGLSHRLGLHQSQKRFSFGALTIETRKKVFWSLYTLDCFSAAILGLPKLMKEDDIHAEYPSDIDDEYVTEKGFQPSLPGEHTRLSSALALFRAARILAKVLGKNYPASTSHELSLQQMSGLEAELDDWSEGLPPHLKLNFKEGKPSTDVTGSRSPLLALAYYYIRTLIYRPAVGSSLGTKAAPALISVSESSKHIVQIVQLLEERGMAFSFCLNKADVLILCGMVLLYQSIDLKPERKMMKDGEKLVNAIIKTIERAKAPGCYDFKRVAALLVTVDELTQSPLPTPPRSSPDSVMAAPPSRKSPPAPPTSAPKKVQPSIGRHASATMSETDLLMQQEKLRRVTMPQLQQHRPELYSARSRPSFDGIRQEQAVARSDHHHRLSLGPILAKQGARIVPTPSSASRQNLDYLSLNSTPAHSQPSSPVQTRAPHHQLPPVQQPTQHTHMYNNGHGGQKAATTTTSAASVGVSTAEWEALLGAMDGGHLNVYDAIYGGPSALSLAETTSAMTQTQAQTVLSNANNASPHGGGWSPDSWDLSTFNIGGGGADFVSSAAPSRSALSLSLSDANSLSSGEELAVSGELGLGVSGLEYGGMTVPTTEGYLLEGLDGGFL